jgi:hypothetical protein
MVLSYDNFWALIYNLGLRISLRLKQDFVKIFGNVKSRVSLHLLVTMLIRVIFMLVVN